MGLKRRIEKLESIARIGVSKHISIDGNSLCVNEEIKRPYFPEKTAKEFHNSHDIIRLLIGCYGCLSCDTEYLSTDGWKRLDEYSSEDCIAEFNIETTKIEFRRPREYVKLPCDFFLHLKNRNGIDQLLSEEHTVLFNTRYNPNRWRTISARELADSHNKLKGGWSGRIPTTFKAPEMPGINLSDDEIRLMVAISADGSFKKRCRTSRCVFSLTKERKKDRLKMLLSSIGIEWSEYNYVSRPTQVIYSFLAPERNKNLWKYIAATEHQLSIFADEFVYWDGHFERDGGKVFVSTIGQNADFIQYALATIGKRASISIIKHDNAKHLDGYRLYTGKNAPFISLRQAKKIERVIATDGIKYCFVTSTGYFVARRNGRIFVTGNSGKSTMCCAEIVFRACAMPPCFDGVRRSRWAIVRNTYGDLTATTLKTWLEWFGELGIVRRQLSPRLRYHHTFNDGAGVVELELLFIALDSAADARKHLGSLELTGAYLNELAEIPQTALHLIQGRVNRFPAKRSCNKPFWTGVIADTNPPETDHWIYNTFETQQLEGHRLFHQPPAVIKTDDGYQMNPEAENIKNLADGYYLQMIQGQSEEFIRVFAMGYYGTVVDGKKVYPQYNDDLHAVADIDIDDNEPLLFAWDYGTVSPACLILQFIADRLYVIKEFVCEYMTVKELAQQSVLPWLNRYAPGLPSEVTADPANTYEGNEQLEELGFLVEPARTNRIGPRINSVVEFLNALVQGRPKIIISKSGCSKLRQGFLGKYCYKRLRVIGEEKYKDVPDKIHPVADIHDCCASGTKITMADGSLINIEDIKPGMYVLTLKGKRKVTHAWLARESAVVGEYTFSNGKKLIATPDHRMFTQRGWVRLSDLQYTDILCSIEKNFARQHVNQAQGVKAALMTKLGNAWSAVKNLVQINIPRSKLAKIRLVSKRLSPEARDVYDLTVEIDHCFFAEGICVHNCLQYACLYYSPQVLSAYDDEEFYDFDHYDEDDKSRVGGY